MHKIAIQSVPRSGSTWLGSIFDSHPNVAYRFQPLFSYAFKNSLGLNSSKEEIDEFLFSILYSQDDFINQKKAKGNGLIPIFDKLDVTHIVYKEVRNHHILENILNQLQDIKIIGIIRNPLSVINSWLRAPKEFRSDLGWKEKEEWRFAQKKNMNNVEEFNGLEKWIEVAKMFEMLVEKYSDKFYLLNYKNIIEKTEDEITKMFDFCDLDVAEQTKQYLYQSVAISNSDPYSVYKNKKKDDAWINELNIEIASEIISIVHSVDLGKYLL